MLSGETLRGGSKTVLTVAALIIVALVALLVTSRYLSKMLQTYSANNKSTNNHQRISIKTPKKSTKKPVNTVCQYSSLFRECHNLSHSDDCDKDSLIKAPNESIKCFKRKFNTAV